MITVISFAERHREARERCSLRQVDVAALVGVRPQTVNAWENEPDRYPEVPTLIRLSGLYGVSCDWLLGNPYADMLHPSLQAARPRLRAFLSSESHLGANATQLALSWLMKEFPSLCSEEFLVRRLGVPASVIRFGNMGGTALASLVELTGIPLAFWGTGDPADLGEVLIDTEMARLHHVLSSKGISVDTVRRAMPHLLALQSESKSAKGGSDP